MEKMKSKVKNGKSLTIVFVGIFVIGIALFIMFAREDFIEDMLPIAIIFTAVGFYGAPIAFIFGYLLNKFRFNTLKLVLVNNMTEVKLISANCSMPQVVVRRNLTWLISHGYLSGYMLMDDMLVSSGYVGVKNPAGATKSSPFAETVASVATAGHKIVNDCKTAIARELGSTSQQNNKNVVNGCKCESCGASVKFVGEQGFCPYCGNMVKLPKK